MGGGACYSNTTNLTTGNWGEWKTEQSGVSSACNNVSKDYFLNINIDGVDQTPRRRLTLFNFLRKDVDEITTGNLTLGEKITFALGEMIDNIVDGWITITGGLNVTGNITADTITANTIVSPYEQVVTVAKSGGDFTTIQDAIDSITDATTDKRYTIMIYPGDYTENIVGKSYIELMGMEAREAVNIKGTTGPLYTFPDNEGHIFNLKFSLLPTTANQYIISVPSTVNARQVVSNCLFDFTTSSNINGRIFDVDGGEVEISTSKITYLDTGNDVGAKTIRIFDIDGSAIVDIINNIVDVNIADIDDIVNFYDDASTTGGDTHIIQNVVHITSNNAGAYSGTVRAVTFVGTGKHMELHANYFKLLSLESGGTGDGIYAKVNSGAGGATIDSNANSIDVQGFATNYWANVAAGDEFITHGDDIVATDGWTGAGVVYYASSLENGNFSVSDTYYVGFTPGITGNYSVGNCWIYFTGGIATSTNCTGI